MNNRLTPKQKKFVDSYCEAIIEKDGQSRTLGSLLQEAGYTFSTSRQPAKILNTKAMQLAIEDKLAPYNEDIKTAYSKAVEAIKTLDYTKQPAQVIANVISVLDRIMRLNEGKATSHSISRQLKIISYKDYQDEI